MAIDQLITGTFEACFSKYFYDELVIGKLAHSEFKSGVKRGDEVDVFMPPTVTLFDYTGGDLPNAELVTNSATKVRIDEGKAFHFEIDEIKKKEIENVKDTKKQAQLASEYSKDGVKQFAAGVDTAFGNLYTRAGHYLDNSGDAIPLSGQTAKDILAYMQAKFKRGDGKGHTNWIDGQMIAIVPPEFQFYLGKIEMYGNVESGHRKLEKGYIGKLAGWDILVSNNIANPSTNVFYPLFGIRAKTLAGGVSSNLNMKHYMPEANFNTRYKGYGLFGVGAPRADFLGTVKISAPLSIEIPST
jgi:hypothetical protein